MVNDFALVFSYIQQNDYCLNLFVIFDIDLVVAAISFSIQTM